MQSIFPNHWLCWRIKRDFAGRKEKAPLAFRNVITLQEPARYTSLSQRVGSRFTQCFSPKSSSRTVRIPIGLLLTPLDGHVGGGSDC